jgi:hypothetical protein
MSMRVSLRKPRAASRLGLPCAWRQVNRSRKDNKWEGAVNDRDDEPMEEHHGQREVGRTRCFVRGEGATKKPTKKTAVAAKGPTKNVTTPVRRKKT